MGIEKRNQRQGCQGQCTSFKRMRCRAKKLLRNRTAMIIILRLLSYLGSASQVTDLDNEIIGSQISDDHEREKQE